MDPTFNLEKWLLQAGIEDNMVTNVAAKLREEECASVSALKEVDDAALQSIGIKVGSRRLILKAAASLADPFYLRPPIVPPVAAAAAAVGPQEYPDINTPAPLPRYECAALGDVDFSNIDMSQFL